MRYHTRTWAIGQIANRESRRTLDAAQLRPPSFSQQYQSSISLDLSSAEKQPAANDEQVNPTSYVQCVDNLELT